MEKFSLANFEIDSYEDIEVDITKAKKGDTNEKNKLIKKYLLLAKRIATSNNYLDEDLLQELIILLVTDVLDSYDETKGEFGLFFTNLANNWMLNYHKYQSYRNHVSINETDNNGEEYINKLIDEIDIEKEYEKKVVFNIIRNFINQLNKKHQFMVKKYYGFNCEPLSMSKIGNELGYSKMHISRELSKIRNYIKKRLLWEGVA